MIRTSVVLSALLVLLLLVGVIPVDGAAQAVVFRTPVFQALCAAFGLALILACVRPRPSWRRAAFVLAHLGVVVILVGAALRAWFGRSGELRLPVGGWHAASHLPGPRGESIPLGFRLSVTDFRVEYYDPVNHLPTDGRITPRGTLTPRLFEAMLTVDRGDGPHQQALRVNHPVTIGAWRVYLTSYGGEETRRVVELSLRRDPGRHLFVAGAWMTIAGVGLLCWRGRARTDRCEGGPR